MFFSNRVAARLPSRTYGRPGEGEHWSRVWVVAVDDQLYVVKVRISGHEFDHVRAEPAPEMAERVAAAIAAKYWSDLLIRFARHPLIVRLSVPVP